MKERATVFPEGKSIVTELLLAPEFYPAENYHHDYYERNKDKMYCQLVIAPKIEKLEQEHNDLLKH
jgi:peptide-methionine (S)-S-oxide reductase